MSRPRRFDEPVMGRVLRIVLRTVFSVFWMAAVLSRSIAAESGEPALVTYIDPTGVQWCAIVRHVEPRGPDGTAWVWMTITADPRRIVHLPQAAVREGCFPPSARA
jgi:hypothetical protein